MYFSFPIHSEHTHSLPLIVSCHTTSCIKRLLYEFSVFLLQRMGRVAAGGCVGRWEVLRCDGVVACRANEGQQHRQEHETVIKTIEAHTKEDLRDETAWSEVNLVETKRKAY